MKRKVGIIIDNNIYKKVKIYCAKHEVGISELFSYAVEMYIERIEILEEEMKNRNICDLVEDNYNEIVKQDLVEIKEIGSGEE